MNQLTEDFFKNSSIAQNLDTIKAMDFLSKPESVNKMIVMSEVGFPALTGVVKELEAQFGSCRLFPLNYDAEDANAPNRRNVGWMVRFIMKAYGYTPVASGLPDAGDSYYDRTRIPKASGVEFFSTAAVYEKTNPNPRYTITVASNE